jgi:hypothetical protein
MLVDMLVVLIVIDEKGDFISLQDELAFFQIAHVFHPRSPLIFILSKNKIGFFPYGFRPAPDSKIWAKAKEEYYREYRFHFIWLLKGEYEVTQNEFNQ